MLAIPLPALVAVNAIRILGVIFVMLHAAGKLPAPFAPSAGWGDIFVGVTALPVAWAMLRFGPRARRSRFSGIRSGSPTLSTRSRSAPYPPRPASGLCRSAVQRADDHFAVAAHSGLSGAGLMFIHIVIFYRLAKTEAAATARPWLSGGAVSA